MRKILIIGATSAIAQGAARLFAARGDALFLVARDAEHLRAVAEDLNVRGAMRAATATLDVTDFGAHAAVLDAAERELGGIDIALIAHGTVSDQAQCQASVEALRREFDINATSTLALLTLLAQPRLQLDDQVLADEPGRAGQHDLRILVDRRRRGGRGHSFRRLKTGSGTRRITSMIQRQNHGR